MFQMNMAQAKRAPGGRPSQPPGAMHSERRVKTAPKWSPTLPSAAAADAEPDPVIEAHATLNEARQLLDTLVLLIDRLARRGRQR
jgi:hypothetical protein